MTTDSRTPTTGSSDLLCDMCSRHLALDDSRIGATWKTSSDGGIGTLSFPNDEGWHRGDEGWCWDDPSGFRRTLTFPDLPELSSPPEERCRFCAALKRALVDRYKDYKWWGVSVAKIIVEIRYRWSPRRSLFSLYVAIDPQNYPLIPTLYGHHFDFPITARTGEQLDILSLRLLTVECD